MDVPSSAALRCQLLEAAVLSSPGRDEIHSSTDFILSTRHGGVPHAHSSEKGAKLGTVASRLSDNFGILISLKHRTIIKYVFL